MKKHESIFLSFALLTIILASYTCNKDDNNVIDSLMKYEKGCAKINACLEISGQSSCMFSPYWDEENPESSKFGAVIGTNVYTSKHILCAENVNNCMDVYRCIGTGISCTPAQNDLQGTCDGDNLIRCLSIAKTSIEAVVPCADYGLHCYQSKLGEMDVAVCGLQQCDMTSYESECVDNNAKNCVYGGEVIQNCDLLYPGSECKVVTDEGVTETICQGTGDDCTVEGDNYGINCIDENTITICLDRKEYVMTCPIDSKCEEIEGEVACRFENSDCESSIPTCSGTILNYCLAGTKQSIDCATIGFTSCYQDENGAYCNP